MLGSAGVALRCIQFILWYAQLYKQSRISWVLSKLETNEIIEKKRGWYQIYSPPMELHGSGNQWLLDVLSHRAWYFLNWYCCVPGQGVPCKNFNPLAIPERMTSKKKSRTTLDCIAERAFILSQVFKLTIRVGSSDICLGDDIASKDSEHVFAGGSCEYQPCLHSFHSHRAAWWSRSSHTNPEEAVWTLSHGKQRMLTWSWMYFLKGWDGARGNWKARDSDHHSSM